MAFNLFFLVIFTILGAFQALAEQVCEHPRGSDSLQATVSDPACRTILLRGNQRVDVTQSISLPSGKTLRCEAGATLVAAAPISDAVVRNALQTGTTDISVEGCTIDAANRALYGIRLSTDPKYEYGLKRARVFGNTIKNPVHQGVFGAGWEDVEVAYNTLIGAKTGNVGAFQLQAQSGKSRRVHVHHNHCDTTGTKSSCFKFSASTSETLSDIRITDNVALVGDASKASCNNDDCDTLGIELWVAKGQDSFITGFTIEANFVKGEESGAAQTFGISVGGASHGSVIKNRVENTSAFGIEIIGSFVTASENSLLRSGPITWDAATSPHTNVTISNNITVEPVSRGIFLYTAGNNSNDTGTISNNTILAPSGEGKCIRIQGVNRNIQILENTCQAASFGIETFSPGLVEIHLNRFLAMKGTGISLNGGGDYAIVGNRYSGSGSLIKNSGGTVKKYSQNVSSAALRDHAATSLGSQPTPIAGSKPAPR